MTIEKNVPVDERAAAIPTVFINRAQVTGVGPLVRVAFAEGFSPDGLFWRMAICGHLADMEEIAQCILTTVQEHKRRLQGAEQNLQLQRVN